ncbi:sulfur oxidation c-type cytochrome SoxX [Steroidobacter sp. S1-65]|uniref:Sulfur oxidation c-type cytochrome SoxX n=1 Tax=Steroidobacter gossypii TaxID=2805490 RepID=A0ABS1WQP1_9GAMM|nr:sulfur oxidation c-type cytochrome SoxX [Steroidobacter gossypii]MBM0103286.1 sulfur oxidation c-type cytochrome SoxX [Steroidobacter gossypii]
MKRRLIWLLLTLCAATSIASAITPVTRLHAYKVEGDAIAHPLAGLSGDAARGASLVQQRHKSLCVLCHAGPFPDPHLQGTIAPDLTGVGARLSAGQLRLRIVNMKRLNPDSIMPVYFEIIADSQEVRVAETWRDRPILTAQEIEDLVAYLQTLR